METETPDKCEFCDARAIGGCDNCDALACDEHLHYRSQPATGEADFCHKCIKEEEERYGKKNLP